MQAYERPDGRRLTDIISANSHEELNERLRANEARRRAEGFSLTDERVYTKNSKCPCGSGKKIKRCCKHIPR